MHVLACALLEDPHPVKVLSMPFDKLMLTYVIVTTIAATAAVITLFAIRGQLKAMRLQLDQMKAAGVQTDQLIAIAKEQADALSVAAAAASKSADAAVKNAEAASMNARALMDSERPWIFVHQHISSSNVRAHPHSEQILPDMFFFQLQNVGRTPAEVVYYFAAYSVCPPTEIHELRIPKVQHAGFQHRAVVAPSNGFQFDKFVTAGPHWTEEDFRSINTGKMAVVFYGLIQYRDTAGGDSAPIRETGYCYRFNPDKRTLEMAGPPGANKRT